MCWGGRRHAIEATAAAVARPDKGISRCIRPCHCVWQPLGYAQGAPGVGERERKAKRASYGGGPPLGQLEGHWTVRTPSPGVWTPQNANGKCQSDGGTTRLLVL